MTLTYFATSVVISLHNGLPWGALPAPTHLTHGLGCLWVTGRLTDPAHLWRLWHCCFLCVGNGASCLLLSSMAQKFTFGGLELNIEGGTFVYWYDQKYSISCHPWKDCKEVKLISPSLPEACHSRRYLEELNGLFHFVSSPLLISDP